MSIGADFSRTCEGCGHIITEPAYKGKAMLRCFAPGPYQGRTVGINQLEPYVPAWCPRMQSGEKDYGTKKWKVGGDSVRNT